MKRSISLDRAMHRARRTLAACAAAAFAIGLAALPTAQAGGHDSDRDRHDNGHDDGLHIQTLSSAPQLVSGGSALVRIDAPGSSLGRTRVALNGRDVTSAFHADSHAGTLTGLVTGLRVGRNTLEANAHGRGGAAHLTLTNYPITGPIISGPHQTPFFCQTDTFTLPDGSKLGSPLDDDCSVNPVVTYLYLPTGATALVPLPSTTQLPADVAMTTTLNHATVPFVVRVETRTVDRGIYQSAVLHDPTKEAAPSPFAPPKGWNRRLVAIEGFGCPGGWYIQGGAEGNLSLAGFDITLLNVARLGEGYAMFANTLQHASNNCNAVLASEATMMSKEQFVKTYGVPEFSVSYGCSGGSYGSAMPADRIPGLFDGILIMCTFPDPISIAFSGSDGHLLTHYWAVTDPTGFTDDQKNAVTGYKSVTAFIAAANQSGRTDPVPGRVDIPGYVSAPFNAIVPTNIRYDPVTNPTGIRGTVYDASKTIYGVDRRTGFALRPFDNVGVQYGLKALNDGVITTTQFLDLNEKIGGYDQDFNYVAARTPGDPGAMRRMQQAGLQTGGNGGLASIPVFDVTGIYNDDNGYHYQWFHFALRERMREANGDISNHLMWRGNPVPADTAWSTFINWVQAYKADTRKGTQRQKVARNRPANAVDGCWKDATTFIAETQVLGHEPTNQCNTLFPSWSAPRYMAGGPLAANVPKCSLKAIDLSEYAVSFTPAEQARLRGIFPQGVCNWSRDGNHTGVVPNGSFGPSPVNYIGNGSRPHHHDD
jgi:Tannase-like family of unknown function (DUF6351)